MATATNSTTSKSYRELFTFGEDYGTSEYKYGPASLGDSPDIVENRGYYPDNSAATYSVFTNIAPKELIVGPEVSEFLEARQDLGERLIYPMKSGMIDRDDSRAWAIVKEITRYGLLRYAPSPSSGFEGFNCVAGLFSGSPKYMYERVFDIHLEINKEEGRRLIKNITVIPQPLAVAIAQKAVTCTVIEAGHGNTQITPISKAIINSALLTLNRGGADVDVLAAEILRDAGYGDLARERKFVKMFKETVGLVPLSLNSVLANKNEERFKFVFKIPGTRITVDLGANAWQRFLLGEFFFDPENEVFSSYYKRGFRKPTDTYLKGELVLGTTNLIDSITKAIEKCSFEIQPSLFRNIFLSGGSFAWKVPPGLEDFACDSATKLTHLLEEKGVIGAKVTLTKNPQFNVWQGCIVYGLFLPEEFHWKWERQEGWITIPA
jgi:crenactin